MCAYQGVKNVRFSEYFAHVLIEYSIFNAFPWTVSTSRSWEISLSQSQSPNKKFIIFTIHWSTFLSLFLLLFLFLLQLLLYQITLKLVQTYHGSLMNRQTDVAKVLLLIKLISRKLTTSLWLPLFCFYMFRSSHRRYSVKKRQDLFMYKLSPISGRCPQWLVFFKNLFYQNNCKEAMNTGGGQIRGALFNCFIVKKCPFLYLPDAVLSFWNNPSLLLSFLII